ncbi:MAG: TonB-dependent receptor plug domain-containing protein, partial [Candidatus Omnitrophica bacterium]|nr:TonB-dependent receptor plug domain-containing protein [Candidatus Omnitrophota bacterium]
MSQIIVWFWYLVFMWLVSFCSTTRFALAAEESQGKADSERRLSASITDFFLGSKGEEGKIPTADTITVIASRLPSFRTRLSDIPANVSYVPANITIKSKTELERADVRMFQESIRDIEGSIFYDQVGNGLDTTFSLRGFSEGSSIIVLMDGVRVNELDGDAVNYPLVPIHDVEFIQIERGSASPIYGSGAFGGVVNIITRKPSPKQISLFGGAEASSFKGFRLNQGASGTIKDKVTPIGGNVTYYFDMGRDQSEGFRENGEWRITSLDTKLGYE